MKKQKSESEKLWDYLVKKVGDTKKAKEIFHRVSKKPKAAEIHIKYHIDNRPLKESVRLANKLQSMIKSIKVAR